MQNVFRLIFKKYGYISFLVAALYLQTNQFAFGLPSSIVPASNKEVPAKTSPEKEPTKADIAANKEKEAQIANAVSVTTEELVTKPQQYLNKDVKFTAKFSSFNSLALDYKPAFRSSRNYISFLVFRPNTHIPFSELKLAMLIPKEKDPETHMLQTLKEDDTLEVYGRVFACPLDEPWLEVIKIKRTATAPNKGKIAEDKDATSDKDAEDESSSENKHE